jgi:hypothetical protein
LHDRSLSRGKHLPTFAVDHENSTANKLRARSQSPIALRDGDARRFRGRQRERGREPDFNFDVRPLLSDRCFKCHGPDEKSRKRNCGSTFPTAFSKSSRMNANRRARKAGAKRIGPAHHGQESR